jgi:Ser/Thr protein kinase RdoA (MazF antagonist)
VLEEVIVIDTAIVQSYLRHNYAIEPVAVACLRRNPGQGRALYRIDDGARQSWLLRLYHREQPVPSWFGGGRAAAWLEERAELLQWLSQLDFPAPRLLPTRAQGRVSSYESWCGLVTSFLAGTTPNNTDETFASLAATLGRLHSNGLRREGGHGSPAARSWWEPLERATRYALEQLASLRELPPEWQPLHRSCRANLEAMKRPRDLPMGCIHGDCWVGNAIRGPEGQITLIDWDAGGRGALILDFAALLGDCFDETAQDVVPDRKRVADVFDSYRRYRTLTGPELEVLPEAIQFGAAYRAAIRFALAVREGWSDGAIRGLRHEQARLATSREIAVAATARLRAQARQAEEPG